jgi:hypothetical protein
MASGLQVRIRIHGPRVAAVQKRTRCGSMKAHLATMRLRQPRGACRCRRTEARNATVGPCPAGEPNRTETPAQVCGDRGAIGLKCIRRRSTSEYRRRRGASYPGGAPTSHRPGTAFISGAVRPGGRVRLLHKTKPRRMHPMGSPSPARPGHHPGRGGRAPRTQDSRTTQGPMSSWLVEAWFLSMTLVPKKSNAPME